MFRRYGLSKRGAHRGLRCGATLTCALLLLGCSPPLEDLHLRVLTTHDIHGALAPAAYPWTDGRPVGGLATLMTLMDAAEAECECPTIRLDGGDQMQGTLPSNLTYGRSVVDGMNLLGIDAAAVGNHELDWGVDTLQTRQGEARYPWLAANVVDSNTDLSPGWTRPWAILEEDGVRVGVVGYITATTPDIVMASIVAPYRFVPGEAGVRAALDAVRSERPDFVVIVAHAAGDCETACRGEMVDLAAELDPGEVHLIVGGHRHAPGFGVVNDIPIIRAGSSGRAVGILDLYRDADGSRRFEMRVDTAWADSIAPAPEMVAVLEPHFQRADSLAGLTLATLEDPLPRSRGEYALGRLVADAVRAVARAQVSVSNRGGVRAGLDAGPVTYGELFQVKPFGNKVYLLDVTGVVLRQVVEVAVVRPDFMSGITAEYDADAPEGRRVRSLTLEDGTPVTPEGRYTLATSNFISEGQDGYQILARLASEPVGTTVLDALIAHIGSLPAPLEGPQNPRLRSLR